MFDTFYIDLSCVFVFSACLWRSKNLITYVYTHAHTYRHTHTYVLTLTHTHTQTRTHTHTHTHIYVYIYIYIYESPTQTRDAFTCTSFPYRYTQPLQKCRMRRKSVFPVKRHLNSFGFILFLFLDWLPYQSSRALLFTNNWRENIWMLNSHRSISAVWITNKYGWMEYVCVCERERERERECECMIMQLMVFYKRQIADFVQNSERKRQPSYKSCHLKGTHSSCSVKINDRKILDTKRLVKCRWVRTAIQKLNGYRKLNFIYQKHIFLGLLLFNGIPIFLVYVMPNYPCRRTVIFTKLC